jgi:hypothetical protein
MIKSIKSKAITIVCLENKPPIACVLYLTIFSFSLKNIKILRKYMDANMRFDLFDENIISDLFGEEVVLVNLDSGVYYSLRGSATEMWIRIQNNYSISEILADLSTLYDLNSEELTNQINLFIEQLIDEKLIKSSQSMKKVELAFDTNNSKISFPSPILEVFSDMQEILLLDPVHDVDKSGWPVTKNINETK